MELKMLRKRNEVQSFNLSTETTFCNYISLQEWIGYVNCSLIFFEKKEINHSLKENTMLSTVAFSCNLVVYLKIIIFITCTLIKNWTIILVLF